MKILKTIPHGSYLITLLAWNNKYLIKIEQGNYEQTYKISELDVANQQEVEEMLQQPDFLNRVSDIFVAMQRNLQVTMKALGI